MNTLCQSCKKPLFEHASDFMVREGHACRGDCQKGRRGTSLPQREALPVQSGSNAKPHKYGAVACLCSHGHNHPSIKERGRCETLHFMQKAGEITDLEYEPVYEFRIGSRLIGRFKPDFRYLEKGVLAVEDVKSKPTRTEAYMLRKKMMLAFFGISVKEI